MAFVVFLILVGHTFFWACAVNRLHSTAIPYRTGKRITEVFFLLMVWGATATAIGYWRSGLSSFDLRDRLLLPWPLKLAAGFSVLLGIVAGIDLVIRRVLLLLTGRTAEHAPRRDGSSSMRKPARRAATFSHASALQRDPATGDREGGNQFARLVPSLDHGLSILHLSYLHYSGRIAKAVL